MDIKSRKQVVWAMDLLAYCVNDEEVFDGPGDGEIGEDYNDIDNYYIQNDTFSDLMSTFLKLMKYANKDGLYMDGITSK